MPGDGRKSVATERWLGHEGRVLVNEIVSVTEAPEVSLTMWRHSKSEQPGSACELGSESSLRCFPNTLMLDILVFRIWEIHFYY